MNKYTFEDSVKSEIVQRRKAIKDLIQQKQVGDQHHLVHLLQAEYGIHTNQAVVSRDLRQLNVVKKKMHNKMVYELAEVNIDEELLKLAVVDIRRNEVMIVIKTYGGLAAFVGDYIDRHMRKGVLGTLAGENVVFVTPESIRNIEKTLQELCVVLHFKSK